MRFTAGAGVGAAAATPFPVVSRARFFDARGASFVVAGFVLFFDFDALAVCAVGGGGAGVAAGLGPNLSLSLGTVGVGVVVGGELAAEAFGCAGVCGPFGLPKVSLSFGLPDMVGSRRRRGGDSSRVFRVQVSEYPRKGSNRRIIKALTCPNL